MNGIKRYVMILIYIRNGTVARGCSEAQSLLATFVHLGKAVERHVLCVFEQILMVHTHKQATGRVILW